MIHDPLIGFEYVLYDTMHSYYFIVSTHISVSSRKSDNISYLRRRPDVWGTRLGNGIPQSYSRRGKHTWILNLTFPLVNTKPVLRQLSVFMGHESHSKSRGPPTYAYLCHDRLKRPFFHASMPLHFYDPGSSLSRWRPP